MATQDTSSFGMWGDFLPDAAQDNVYGSGIDAQGEVDVYQQIQEQIEVALSGAGLSQDMINEVLNMPPDQALQASQALQQGGAQALAVAARTGEATATGNPYLDKLVQQAAEDYQQSQAFGEAAMPFVLGSAGTSLGYAGANGALANETEAEQERNNPFGFPQEFLAPIIAMLEGITNYAQNNGIDMTNEQGQEVPIQALGNLAPPSTPVIAQSQGLGIG